MMRCRSHGMRAKKVQDMKISWRGRHAGNYHAGVGVVEETWNGWYSMAGESGSSRRCNNRVFLGSMKNLCYNVFV